MESFWTRRSKDRASSKLLQPFLIVWDAFVRCLWQQTGDLGGVTQALKSSRKNGWNLICSKEKRLLGSWMSSFMQRSFAESGAFRMNRRLFTARIWSVW